MVTNLDGRSMVRGTRMIGKGRERSQGRENEFLGSERQKRALHSFEVP